MPLSALGTAAAATTSYASEPFATALLLATFAVLTGASVVLSRTSERTGVPVALIFLGLGMLAGSEGLGGIPFEDYHFAFRVGTVALVLILFGGGINTSLSALRPYALPAGVLATVGVALTAMIVAIAAHLLGAGWPVALVLGAVVSSTDAAAVFAALRGSGIQLRKRVGITLEGESGLNDPVAVIFTTVLTTNLANGTALTLSWSLLGAVLWQIVGGALGGATVGYGGRWLLRRVRLAVGGLYPVLTLSLACLSFAAPTLVDASGFLAVYVAGIILGNSELPYREGLARVHDALAWVGQVVMFLMLGLLVFPSRLLAVASTGVVLGLVLAVVARPVAVALCLVPFRSSRFGYTTRELGYIGWVGLRGAVPIVLALFPVMAGVPDAFHVFDVVCAMVIVNALIPGTTVRWLTEKLGLSSDEPPPPPAVLAIESREPLSGELLSFYVDDALDVSGVPLSDLPFPPGASATLVVRGRELIAPRGTTVLQAGDHVYVVTTAEDRPVVQLLFGRPESSG